MRNDPDLEKMLVKTGAYQDLEYPVILTSGELGIYYINTEKLCPDRGRWKRFGDDSYSMVYHSIIMAQEHTSFQDVIKSIAACVSSLFPLNSAKRRAVAGGQRRDWIFSGPVAFELGIPHISLYKQEKGKKERIEFIDTHTGSLQNNLSLQDYTVIPIVDLITEGSSIYRHANGKEKGWVPMLRQRGAQVDHLVAVVTREQGGEHVLAKQGVVVHPLTAIDKRFIETHSQNHERALVYMENPQRWAEEYLLENGALQFVSYFDPAGGKQDRAQNFLQRYAHILKSNNSWKDLQQAVEHHYRIKFK